jgi:hypothetical protein
MTRNGAPSTARSNSIPINSGTGITGCADERGHHPVRQIQVGIEKQLAAFDLASDL